MSECHCGKDGHMLHSVNCPVHGREAQVMGIVAALREVFPATFNGSTSRFMRKVATVALDSAERVRG